MNIRLIAVLVFAVALFSGVAIELPTNQLPANIPIGSPQAFLDSMVKSENTEVYIYLGFRESGQTLYSGISFSRTIGFPSYQNFDSYVRSTIMYLKQEIIESPYLNEPSPQAQSKVVVLVEVLRPIPGGHDYDNTEIVLGFEKPLGLFHNISSNNIGEFQHIVARGVVYVTNVSSINLEVKTSSTSYYRNQYSSSTGTWTNTSGSFPTESYNPQMNILFLNPWYATGTNRTRITVKQNQFTDTYTQNGARVGSPTIMHFGKDGRLRATIPVGVDSIIQSTTNMVNWRDEYFFPWSLRTNEVWATSPLSAGPAQKPGQVFYRARVW